LYTRTPHFSSQRYALRGITGGKKKEKDRYFQISLAKKIPDMVYYGVVWGTMEPKHSHNTGRSIF
jgi:hypothetical protein